MRIKAWQADAVLLGVALIWGSTFVLVKNAIADIPPFTFLAVRFTIAAVVLVMFRLQSKLWRSRELFKRGISIGLLLFGGYAFQTWGLLYTTAAKAGFITGLSVVLVPVIVAVVDKRCPSKFTLTGVLMAAVGLAMLSLEGWSINRGDFLVFLCAFCFAGHIYTVGRYSALFDAVVLTSIQIATVGIASALVSTVLVFLPDKITADLTGTVSLTANVWWGLGITAIPATSLAFLLQTRLQQYTTATHTALIFSSEPVFSYMFAYLIAGEVLTLKHVLGATLIMSGILMAEFVSSKKEERVNETKEAGCDCRL